MKNLDQEECINRHILRSNTGRKAIAIEETAWGELLLPGKNENPEKKDEGLRVVVFASFLLGYILFETLKEFESRFPEKFNIVGLVTDDPSNPNAKISLKRRIWRLFNQEKREYLETSILESALTFGVPCYTGEVKIDYFRKLLSEWNPHVIIVCVFGQIIDRAIIEYPPLGIYNFHPSDLKHHFGAGPRPFEDLIKRQAHTSRVTIHYVTEDVDGGHIVGQSPPVNIRLKNGDLTENILVLDDKMLTPIDQMAVYLIPELIRKKDRGEEGPLVELDFEKLFSVELKEKLMAPIEKNVPSEILPVPDKNLKYFI